VRHRDESMMLGATLIIVHGTRSHGWYVNLWCFPKGLVTNIYSRLVELQPLKRSDGSFNVL
jgi:hypothetical protein